MNREEAAKKGYDFYMEDELKDPQENTIENLTERLNKSKKSRDAFISNIKQKAKCNNLPQEFVGCIPLDLATELLKKMEKNHPDLKNVLREARAFLELDLNNLASECKTMNDLEKHLIDVITPTPLIPLKIIKDYLVDIETIKNILPDYNIEPQQDKQENILKFDEGEYDPDKIPYEPNEFKPIQQLIDIPEPPKPDPILPPISPPVEEVEEFDLKQTDCEELIKNAEEYKMVYRNYELPPLIQIDDNLEEDNIIIDIPEEIVPDIPTITIPKIPNIEIPTIPKTEICDFDMLTKTEIENMIVKITEAPKDWCEEIGCKRPQISMVYVCSSNYTVIQMSKEQADASGVTYYDTQSECQNNCKKPNQPIPPNDGYVWACTGHDVPERISKECAIKLNVVHFTTEQEALNTCPVMTSSEPWVWYCRDGKHNTSVKESYAINNGLKYYTSLKQLCANCPESTPPPPPPPTDKDVYICAKGPTPKKVKEFEAKSMGVDYWDKIHIAQKNCEKVLVWWCDKNTIPPTPKQTTKYHLDVTKRPYEFNKEDLECNSNDIDVWYCDPSTYTVKRTKKSIAERNNWLYDCCSQTYVMMRCKPNRDGWACNDNHVCYQTKENDADKKGHDFYLTANECGLNCKRTQPVNDIVYACTNTYTCYKTTESQAKKRNEPYWKSINDCGLNCKRPTVDKTVYYCDENTWTIKSCKESEAKQLGVNYSENRNSISCEEPPAVMVWICNSNSGNCTPITEDEAKRQKNQRLIDKFYYTENECKNNCIAPCSDSDFDVYKDDWKPHTFDIDPINVIVKNYDSGDKSLKLKRLCKYRLTYNFKLLKDVSTLELPVYVNISIDCSGSMSKHNSFIQDWFNDQVLIKNNSKFDIYRQSWNGNSDLTYSNKTAIQMKNLKLWDMVHGNVAPYNVRVHRCYSIINDPIIGQGTRTRFNRNLTWVSRGFYEFLQNINIKPQYKNIAVFLTDFEECQSAQLFYKNDCLFGTGDIYRDMFSTFRCTTKLMDGIKNVAGNKEIDKLILINFSSKPTSSDFSRSEYDLKQALPNIRNIKYYNAYPRVDKTLTNIQKLFYDIEGNESTTEEMVIKEVTNNFIIETDKQGLLKQSYYVPHGVNIPYGVKIEKGAIKIEEI